MRRFAYALFALVMLVPAFARADAREVSTRVVEEWKRAGAKAQALPTRFVFDDEQIKIAIPSDETVARCTQIAIIGARGLSFRGKLEGVSNDPLMPVEPQARGQSTAGVLELRRCDPSRPIPFIFVASDAGRGAIEVVVAFSPLPLPSLAAIIPERTGGVLPPPPEAGVLSALAPEGKRAEVAEQRARRDGATIEARTNAVASDEGTGEIELDVEPGCHRVEVFARADRLGRRYRLDLDAEIRDGDHILARDRTEAPDARLEACVGTSQTLTLAFAGAPPNGEVLVARASWKLPARIPPLWGPSARSKMARVMLTRHVAVPADDPVYLAQGGPGLTGLPIPVEVGGCYVAVVGVTHGHARQLLLRTTVGARESTDERGAADEAALSAFCVRAHEAARVEIQARPSGVGWGLAVFRVKSGVWEAGR